MDFSLLTLIIVHIAIMARNDAGLKGEEEDIAIVINFGISLDQNRLANATAVDGSVALRFDNTCILVAG